MRWVARRRKEGTILTTREARRLSCSCNSQSLVRRAFGKRTADGQEVKICLGRFVGHCARGTNQKAISTSARFRLLWHLQRLCLPKRKGARIFAVLIGRI